MSYSDTPDRGAYVAPRGCVRRTISTECAVECRGHTHYIYDEKNVLQSFRSVYRRLSRESGFDISSHRFRHALATELMKSPDRNLKRMKDLLGHRNVSTTMKYIELDMEVAGKALEQGLALHTDITATRSLQSVTQA